MDNDKKRISGIHHITAITGDSRSNIEFYTSVLGLRFIKLTVNFDDPSAYHLYFGDEIGRPGTVLTFFAWPGARKGIPGAGQAEAISFSVPGDALEYWAERLGAFDIVVEDTGKLFGDEYVSFFDPDGLRLQLVSRGDDHRPGWSDSPVPTEFAIRGFFNITVLAKNHEPTAHFLTDLLGFTFVGRENNIFRYHVNNAGAGAIIDVRRAPEADRGLIANGSIHHIAWRSPDDDEQIAWGAAIARSGLNVTQIVDRHYFRSIYFREPGGVLFEIATDLPGFTIDEAPDQLGTELKLPPWMERNRQQIERNLPPLDLRRVYQKL
jgi:catechol 2,3-dioxygenase-like lactoylglutathione lyase family enzyme